MPNMGDAFRGRSEAEETRTNGRISGWPGETSAGEWSAPDGEALGDGIPDRTLGPEPLVRGMMLTTPDRLPGGPTGLCCMRPPRGRWGPASVSRGKVVTGCSGLILLLISRISLGRNLGKKELKMLRV
jgi:hypothetical protein